MFDDVLGLILTALSLVWGRCASTSGPPCGSLTLAPLLTAAMVRA
jgi:hypothetical protein